ncbi:protein adenylyltransferase SelO family protein [Sorangium sp. So ce1182]|uniref:protein adenylyltransferase SelO family protein n=1 Tax=Sorangium sp. So ce1182 TaxID=3133334 RepID=UPI003F626318
MVCVDAERGRQLDLGTEGRARTPWSRARTGHGRLALKRGARDVLATGTPESLGVAASRSLTQAVRDGRGALANGRAAHLVSSNGESSPGSAGKAERAGIGKRKDEAGRAKPSPHLRDSRILFQSGH